MKIIDQTPSADIGPASQVVAYYDRQTRAWWAFLADAAGNQIGDAKDDIDRACAIRALGHQAMVFDLQRTPTLLDAYNKLTDQPKSAYEMHVSLAALNNLVKRRLAKDVTPPGPGGMFSPSTHYQFVKVGGAS